MTLEQLAEKNAKSLKFAKDIVGECPYHLIPCGGSYTCSFSGYMIMYLCISPGRPIHVSICDADDILIQRFFSDAGKAKRVYEELVEMKSTFDESFEETLKHWGFA